YPCSTTKVLSSLLALRGFAAPGDGRTPNHHFSRFTFYVSRLTLPPMIQRYSRPEMRAIWTDENKLKIWLQIELLASEALVKEGVVPAEDFAKMKRGGDAWFG